MNIMLCDILQINEELSFLKICIAMTNIYKRTANGSWGTETEQGKEGVLFAIIIYLDNSHNSYHTPI